MLQEILNVILGTGFVGSAILNYYVIQQNKELNKQNKIYARLQLQINNLYAPLYHLVLENENTLKLHNKYYEEYNKRFVNKNWSQDKRTQENLQKEASELIKAASNLINNFVVSTNEKIFDLIEKQSSYMDNDDQHIFIEFKQHYNRLKTEYNKDGRLSIPYEIYRNLGDVSYFLPSFVERVKEKYNKKIDAFYTLLNK